MSTADLFLYHGFRLEQWVNATMESVQGLTTAQVSAFAPGDAAIVYEDALIDEFASISPRTRPMRSRDRFDLRKGPAHSGTRS